jgi:prepilin peptidase CpaA
MDFLLSLIFILCFLAMIILSLIAVYTDIKRFTIANKLCLAIALSFLPAYFAAPEVFGSLWNPWLGGAVMLLAGFVIFALRIMGGGDAKLAAALGFWVGFDHLFIFIFVWSLVGGLQAILTLYLKWQKPFEKPEAGGWVDTAQKGGNHIPYGLALVAGAFAALWLNPLLQNKIFNMISTFY